MSWFQTVDERRLNDARVRGRSTLAKLVWHHLLVGESATRIPGLARGGPATIAERIGESAEGVAAALAELETEGRAIEVDAGERMIRLIDVAADYARPARSAQTVLHWLKLADDLPRSRVVARALAELARVCPAELPNGKTTLRCAAEWNIRINAITSPRGPAEQAPPRPLASPADPPQQALAPADEPPRPRLTGPAEAPPTPPRGPAEAPPLPPGSGSGSGDVVVGRSRSRSKIQDLENPLTPEGGSGSGPEDAVELALEVLRAGARRLGTEGPGPATRAERRALARLAGEQPDVHRRLAKMAARQVERVARDHAKGLDVRHLLTLKDVVREWPRLVGSTHLDIDARAPPRGRPAMLSAPK